MSITETGCFYIHLIIFNHAGSSLFRTWQNTETGHVIFFAEIYHHLMSATWKTYMSSAKMRVIGSQSVGLLETADTVRRGGAVMAVILLGQITQLLQALLQRQNRVAGVL